MTTIIESMYIDMTIRMNMTNKILLKNAPVNQERFLLI